MTPAIVRYFIKTITLIPRMGCYQLSKFIPRNDKMVCVGAWFGDLYADNPKYFVEYLLSNSDFEVVWVGNKTVEDLLPKHPRLSFVEKNSVRSVVKLLRAKYWMCCIFHPLDLTNLPIDGGAICINVWHGIPIKQNGNKNTVWDKSCAKGRGVLAMAERLYTRLVSGAKEWLLVSSEKMERIQLDGYPAVFMPERILNFGSPRNDYFIQNRGNANLRATLKREIASRLGFSEDKKIVLYMPTWRFFGKNVFCFYAQSVTVQVEMKSLMEKYSAILIEKHHFHTYEIHKASSASICSTVITNEQSMKIDPQQLLLCADVLITDYSSAFVDFGLLQRPCIHFAYDLEDYLKVDSGLSYDLRKVAAGPVVMTFPELLHSLDLALRFNRFEPAVDFHSLVEYESGNACGRLLSFMQEHR